MLDESVDKMRLVIDILLCLICLPQIADPCCIRLTNTFPTIRNRGIPGPQGPQGPAGSWCGYTSVTNTDFTTDGKEGSPTTQTFTIDSPGWYLLCESISFQGSSGNETAISIQSNNVTIDFNELSLTTADTIPTKGIVIEGGYSNIKIRGNGAIAGFRQYGIHANGSSSNNISDVSISYMKLFNMTSNSNATGLYVSYCNKCSVSDSLIYNNKRGLDCRNNNTVTLRNSTITKNNNNGGAYLKDCSIVKIEKSIFNNNQYASGNHLELHIENGNDTTIDECVFHNYLTGLSNNLYSLYTKSCNGLTIKNNSFTHAVTNNGSSIYLDTVTKGIIDNNNFLRSSASGTANGIELTSSQKIIISCNQMSHYNTAVYINSPQTPITSSIYNNKFFYNTNVYNSFPGINAAFIEATGTPHNLTGLTDAKVYENIIIQEDQSS